MMLIAITQRVILDAKTGYSRDALNQSWIRFLSMAGYLPLIIPNEINVASRLITHYKPEGLLLTGGNNLCEYAGDALERDIVERQLLRWAIESQRPVLGVCRGMQLIQDYFGIKLSKVENHVCHQQKVIFNGYDRLVNSYHHYGTKETTQSLSILATAKDGVIKAIRHKVYPIYGIMWHPERFSPFHEWDLNYMKQIFSEQHEHA